MPSRRPEAAREACSSSSNFSTSRAKLTGMRRLFCASVLAASGVVLVTAACTTDYQKGLDDPNFGAPNALAGQKQPGASSEVATTASGDGGGGGGSSGSSPIVCVSTGGTLLDGGPCAVSFKN